MEQRNFTLEVLTPTFLGDAGQSAAWRSPPIKAQLRRWWRVAAFAQGVRLPELRLLEGRLFGDAAGNHGEKSKVRLRLTPGKGLWGDRHDSSWQQSVKKSQLRMANGLPADGYLGYGRVKTKGATESALPAGEKASIRLAWPAKHEGAAFMDNALGLFHRLGSLGGRNRNGWGACHLADPPGLDLTDFSRPWEAALEESWIHAIGCDSKGLLLWQTTAAYESWEGALRRLGEVRKWLCREADGPRPLLSSPVTGQAQRGLDRNARIPNTLQLKVVRDDQQKYRGQIVHLPCRPEAALWQALPASDRRDYPRLWQSAHSFLDQQSDLKRVDA
ncbi:hypothetical protein CKO15_10870 [Halorhodospira abdelmalekii]|uniref:RAMP superfamily CRISPR-associated protein n=1 Tax=Halorhodospira abdelmalekii TaxID=421629 RepID=UPI001909003F|nr:RAMP superfamily CRISPR-associated protein [Halorhodospira abdelmalekii]MBK1735771.1 hypothetical protein [Halorhodospira abdelmalekii]